MISKLFKFLAKFFKEPPERPEHRVLYIKDNSPNRPKSKD